MNYPNPCDTCKEPKCVHPSTGCSKWQMRFRTIWKQFNTYQLRKYSKTPAQKKFRYEHPDMIGKYLAEGPCKECQFKLLCDVPCVAYWCWWDARMAVLKKKYGMEK